VGKIFSLSILNARGERSENSRYPSALVVFVACVFFCAIIIKYKSLFIGSKMHQSKEGI